MNSLTSQYKPEEFSDDESVILSRYFSNLHGPVFAMHGLSQAVMGALFARYSRTHKSLRQLFLDEFLFMGFKGEELEEKIKVLADDLRAGKYPELEVGSERASDMYDRVVAEFGDDSVNQLGGAHLAVERCSNILTKQLEWGRLSAYLEQSTRYIQFDKPGPDGHYRYMVPQEVIDEGMEDYYRRQMDSIFELYGECVAGLQEYLKVKYPYEEAARLYRKKNDGELSEAAYKTSIRTQACDIARAMLPASTISNTGWFGPGQQFEINIQRLRAHPLAEMRDFAELAVKELQSVIPEFLKRIDIENKGLAATHYLREREEKLRKRTQELLKDIKPENRPVPSVEIVDWEEVEEAEVMIVAGSLYRHSTLPKAQLLEIARKMKPEERLGLLREAAGERLNRRHKPGREFEDVYIELDILADYGSFRDLQRHRMLTMEWQELSTNYSYAIHEDWEKSGLAAKFHEAMEISRKTYEKLAKKISTTVAQYAVCLGYPIRYRMRFNLREAFHLFELRTSNQAHPVYKAICLEAVRQLREVAGYDRFTALMIYLGADTDSLTRLEASAATEKKLAEIEARARR